MENKATTIAEIRVQISSCFREAERQIDFLQNEIGNLHLKLAEAEKRKAEDVPNGDSKNPSPLKP